MTEYGNTTPSRIINKGYYGPKRLRKNLPNFNYEIEDNINFKISKVI